MKLNKSIFNVGDIINIASKITSTVNYVITSIDLTEHIDTIKLNCFDEISNNEISIILDMPYYLFDDYVVAIIDNKVHRIARGRGETQYHLILNGIKLKYEDIMML